MSGHALARHAGADEKNRTAANGGDRLAAIEEMPDQLDAAGEIAQIDGRAPAGKQQAVIVGRIDVIEGRIGAQWVPGTLDALVPARLLLKERR